MAGEELPDGSQSRGRGSGSFADDVSRAGAERPEVVTRFRILIVGSAGRLVSTPGGRPARALGRR